MTYISNCSYYDMMIESRQRIENPGIVISAFGNVNSDFFLANEAFNCQKLLNYLSNDKLHSSSFLPLWGNKLNI